MAPLTLHVHAMQTVIPAEVTAPGRLRIIRAAAPLSPEALQSRFHAVLYYRRAEESPLDVAAWIKESLNAALPAEPVLAGRLRKEGGGWEIRCNDGGVRLVQASVPELSLPEFLESVEREGLEAHLAYWTDIDLDSPDFSSLFNIQVTQFQGDGYSIGITCSLLLCHPLLLTRFLQYWVKLHNEILARPKSTEPPMFHLSYFQRPNRPMHLKSMQLESSPTVSTLLFKVAGAPSLPPNDMLASACFEEATRRLGKTLMAPSFSLMINDHAGDIEIEQDYVAPPKEGFDGASSVIWWDELGLEEMILVEGNKPIQVSCQIVSSRELVVVMMMPPKEDGASDVMVSVTVP